MRVVVVGRDKRPSADGPQVANVNLEMGEDNRESEACKMLPPRHRANFAITLSVGVRTAYSDVVSVQH